MLLYVLGIAVVGVASLVTGGRLGRLARRVEALEASASGREDRSGPRRPLLHRADLD